ncbi:probable serine/threonine-protein kinase At1g54610 [Durio zibethinus]|uniref:Probable serine/threonine-protein kinase At1g54610 n=1 Tax=Durio zibethinus TaxID=66656 RepID=A0A6P6BAG6_DURZI|nr:probable serine/threonine-protein kinase At1g54610 [Durio zibethinus]
MSKKIEGDELDDGWPKWLVDNIPTEVLAGLVPKSADSYDKLAKVRQGTYSKVYKARDRDTGKIVALKKVRFNTSEPECVKFVAREIMILQKLNHPNIISLEGLATSRKHYSLYLVFDFVLSDLTKVITRPGERLTEPQIKCYMQQLLSGLQHCHERGILHRDIKGSNLLIDRNGVLKIANFGLANSFSPKPERPLTSRVVTLWYRAPELLLGSTDYGVGIDLWSAGCLLAEMFVGRPILPGRTEVEQLHRILKLCGTPSEDFWKKMKLPSSFRPPQHYKPGYQEVFGDFPDSSVGLLTMLLALDPSYRGTAASALQSEFFSSSPLACDLSGLPVIYEEEEEPYKTKQSSKKEKQKGRESCNSASSTSSSVKPIKHEENLRALLSTDQAHPNATQNIQNLTLLQASTADIIKYRLDNPQYRSSVSRLDFRTLNLDKISKLFGCGAKNR